MTTDVFRPGTLAGKSILVTGGGGGLGREIARALAAKGSVVHICGRRKALIEETAAAIQAESGSPVFAHVCDIREPDAIEAMMDAIWAHGPLTGLVNNAAANFIAPTKDLSPRAFRAIASTVMDGNFYATLSVGKRWIATGQKGSIVSNLVTWVFTGSAFVVPSAMSKTALLAMTRSLAVEWGRYGIRVNATAPGPFPTDEAWEKLAPTKESKSSTTSCDTIPLGRFGEIAELQNLLVFLLSDACNFITGQAITIDGGQSLAAPSTFADLTRMSDADWTAARAAIEESTARSKAAR
jgi:NAD(P)-dependent dehydrogenase (short-subunit alcohol dehydrogenase family)